MWKYLLYYFAFHVLGRLPLPLLYGLANLIGDAAYCLAGNARRNVWDNLRHVMPAGAPRREVARAARQVFRNVALYYADIARLPHLDAHQFFDHQLVTVGLEEHLMSAVRSGQGVVMLTGHYGNPEMVAQALVALGVRAVILTEPVKPPRLSRLMDAFRSSKGLTFMPVGVPGVKRVMRTLRQGGVVALTGDRDIQGPKEMLPFFGVETLMPTGPIEVALRTGATVIPCFSVRKGRGRYEAYMEPPLNLTRTGDLQQDVRRGELQFLERFERHVREHPEQWAVLESVWDTTAQPGHRQPAAAGGE